MRFDSASGPGRGACGSTIDAEMEHISSRQNSIVKQFRMLLDPPRHRGGASDADRLPRAGAHLLEEALAANLPTDAAAIRDDVGGLPAGTLARRAAAPAARLTSVATSVHA